MRSRCFFALSLVVIAMLSETAAGESLPAGYARFAYCTVCHGVDLNGNQAVGAPNLGVLEGEYIRHSLQAYRDGWRGLNGADDDGHEMRAIALTIDPADIDSIIDFTDGFEPARARKTIAGDAARGEILYRTCRACHGDSAEGNADLASPRLAGQNDWYLARQLMGFKEGWRGASPGDIAGMQMRPFAQGLETRNEINDIVAYINTLTVE